MKKSEIYKVLSPEKLAAVVFVYVAFVELFIVFYLDYIGYAPITNFYYLMYRYLISVAIAFFGGYVAGFMDLRGIAVLDRYFTWQETPILRLTLQLLFVTIIGIFVAFFLTAFVNTIQEYPEKFYKAFVNNMMVSILSNLMLMIILDLWISIIEKNKMELKEQIVENEISNLKYDVLKSQIEPHFIFNNLNTMSYLIESDSEKAQRFFGELSQIYRYILATIDCKCVKLCRELEFLNSYIYLSDVRFSDTIIFNLHKSEEYLEWWLPPLSLQFAVENVLKHNSASELHPLIINIYCSEGSIFVVNNISYKFSKDYSTGLGQSNINKRYSLITEMEPKYFTDGSKYFSKFPLIPTNLLKNNNC